MYFDMTTCTLFFGPSVSIFLLCHTIHEKIKERELLELVKNSGVFILIIIFALAS